jgi:hypothetical protein
MTQVQNYWQERYNNLPNYIVVAADGDGVDYYTVIHKKNENEFRSGCYHSDITHGISLKKSEMQELADKMNQEEIQTK